MGRRESKGETENNTRKNTLSLGFATLNLEQVNPASSQELEIIFFTEERRNKDIRNNKGRP